MDWWNGAASAAPHRESSTASPSSGRRCSSRFARCLAGPRSTPTRCWPRKRPNAWGTGRCPTAGHHRSRDLRPEGGPEVKIGVLGAGHMAEALVPHWLEAGHDVLIGGRTVSNAVALAKRLGARGGSLREAAEFGDVVLLAVLHGGIDATLRAAGAPDGALAGKPLLDCNNPVETERFTLVSRTDSSLAQQ